MDRELIIRLAREAGLEILSLDGEEEVGCGDGYHIQTDLIERFAALVAAQEREAILDEWSDRVQSDLEHGVKFLNEQAAEKWRKDYPQIADFAAAIRSRT